MGYVVYMQNLILKRKQLFVQPVVQQFIILFYILESK